MIIKDEKDNGKVSNYAEILDLAMAPSEEDDFDIVLDVTFKNLTALLRNKTGRILLHLSLDFDEGQQEMSVGNFKLKGNTGNWLMNNSMEAVANTFMHKKIRNQMVFNFNPIIASQLEELNLKLDEPYEINKGINLYGRLKAFRVEKIIPRIKHFYILVNIEADAVVDIEELNLKTTPAAEDIIPVSPGGSASSQAAPG